MRLALELLTPEEISRIHSASVQILVKTGIRFDSEEILNSLERAGARIDRNGRVAFFTERLIEDQMEKNSDLVRKGRKLHLVNGVTSERSDTGAIRAKISGGCDKYLDFESGLIMPASTGELVNHVRLGEMLPEVDFIGPTVLPGSDLNGRRIDERMKRIKAAAVIARNTRKCGSMEVWDIREIDFLVDLGMIARGSTEAYFARPCFVTAKETISPLHLDETSGNILLELARRDLPCTVIPMPISGMSSPVTRLGNAILANAEILGVITAIRSAHPRALVGGGTISGVLDMQTSVVSFSAPEAILQDIAVAEVHDRLYGLDFLIGSGYTDARYPNPQVLAEKAMKFAMTRLSGRSTYPVGLINGGSVFSLEQALVDLEICRFIQSHFQSLFDFDDLDEVVSLIDRVGIRGSFIAEDHTLRHFRENWLPQILDRSGFTNMDDVKTKDIYRNATEKVKSLLASGEFWEIDAVRAREIDKVVSSAERLL